MNNSLLIKYQCLTHSEKNILYSISVLPDQWLTIKDLYVLFNLKTDTPAGLNFFDSLSNLKSKGWLLFNKDAYKMNRAAKNILYAGHKPEAVFFKRIIKTVGDHFSKPVNADTGKDYLLIADNIFKNITGPTKQIVKLAETISLYFHKQKAKKKALLYSLAAVKFQELVNNADENMCRVYVRRAVILQWAKLYNQAEEAALECIKIGLSEKEDTRNIQAAYGILSSIYLNTKNYFKSIECASNAVHASFFHGCSQFTPLSLCRYNAAYSYFKLGDFESAADQICKAYNEFCFENRRIPRFFSILNLNRLRFLLKKRLNS